MDIVDSQVHIGGAGARTRLTAPGHPAGPGGAGVAIGGERIYGSTLLLPEGSANVGA
jgi:hypothetical protein